MGLKPPISNTTPQGKPNPRVNTPTGQPPKAVASTQFPGAKTGLPNLPSVFQLFHRPRVAGK